MLPTIVWTLVRWFERQAEIRRFSVDGIWSAAEFQRGDTRGRVLLYEPLELGNLIRGPSFSCISWLVVWHVMPP